MYASRKILASPDLIDEVDSNSEYEYTYFIQQEQRRQGYLDSSSSLSSHSESPSPSSDSEELELELEEGEEYEQDYDHEEEEEDDDDEFEYDQVESPRIIYTPLPPRRQPQPYIPRQYEYSDPVSGTPPGYYSYQRAHRPANTKSQHHSRALRYYQTEQFTSTPPPHSHPIPALKVTSWPHDECTGDNYNYSRNHSRKPYRRSTVRTNGGANGQRGGCICADTKLLDDLGVCVKLECVHSGDMDKFWRVMGRENDGMYNTLLPTEI
ncbi:hypothetical protein AA313_de0208360 [Arthrobotrys entomopaga]|nr:hypothetical protein AA313_de0208360 [Arthrobotrys entomopaga]